MQTNVLIIGSGIAGLFAALKINQSRPDLRIIIATKGEPQNSNSRLAQGGIAIALPTRRDLVDHIEDTLIAGDGLCDESVVELIVQEGKHIIADFEAIGVLFDKDANQVLDRCREGGHSASRIIHHKDSTGHELIFKLLAAVNATERIRLLENYFALDLIMDEGNCSGATFLNLGTGETINIHAENTILATGGIGDVYGLSTNVQGSGGDGIALAQRVGIEPQDMEFIQFHPTALYDEQKEGIFLISEAVRGAGGKLINSRGERFMRKYDQRLELAPRDIVARAIFSEIQCSDQAFVYLDCTTISEDAFSEKFPSIRKRCLVAGIDPGKQMIPVFPVQHYCCGGIPIDIDGKTSVPQLFASGECSRSGLHGANRLASNSLLEAVVISKRIAQFICKRGGITRKKQRHVGFYNTGSENFQAGPFLLKRLQQLMSTEVGIVRTNYGLALARVDLMEIKKMLPAFPPKDLSQRILYEELRNMIPVAQSIVDSALARQVNLGGHYNLNNHGDKMLFGT